MDRLRLRRYNSYVLTFEVQTRKIRWPTGVGEFREMGRFATDPIVLAGSNAAVAGSHTPV